MAQETTIKTIAIASIILTMMTIAGVSFISMLSASQGSQINKTRIQNFNDSFNKLTEIDASYSELYNKTTTAESTNPIYNLFDTIFNKASSIMRGIKNSFTFMDDYFKGLVTTLGLPAWIIDILGLLLTIVLIFSFLRLIFQREP